MKLKHVTGNLFEIVQQEWNLDTNQDADVYLAHCISSDFALGAGIAVQFSNKLNMRQKLFERFRNDRLQDKIIGKALLVDHVFNLVTKKHCYDKPTYDSVRKSLEDMKQQCKAAGIHKVAMPRIASGLDRLNWNKVLEIIKSVFIDTDIEIVIYSLDPLPED